MVLQLEINGSFSGWEDDFFYFGGPRDFIDLGDILTEWFKLRYRRNMRRNVLVEQIDPRRIDQHYDGERAIPVYGPHGMSGSAQQLIRLCQ